MKKKNDPAVTIDEAIDLVCMAFAILVLVALTIVVGD